MKHVVMFSGGVSSWYTARVVKEKYGVKDMVLLFCDTLTEDEDLYRFLKEARDDIGAPLVHLKDGRSVWELFFHIGMMGNSRMDPCSQTLKRQVADNWIKDNCNPKNTIVYIGIKWDEINRFDDGNGRGIKHRKFPWIFEAPLCDAPYPDNDVMWKALKDADIKPPRLYSYGFPHNNCGGFCIKAGHTQFKLLLKHFPKRYKHHEMMEQKFRFDTGKDVAILRDRSDKKVIPLTLKELRERIETDDKSISDDDYGGCGCFID